MYLCRIKYLSQTLVQDRELGSDHREGQMLAPCPPYHQLDEEEEEEDAYDDEEEVDEDNDLEEGKHDEVLHLDTRVDEEDHDGDDDEHLEEGEHDEVLHPDADVDDRIEPTEGWTEVPLA